MTGKRWIISCVVLALLVLSAVVTVMAASPVQEMRSQDEAKAPQASLGTAFTYQGQLKRDGQAATDTCDMAFRLYDQDTAGSQVGSAITTTVPISDGLFTVPLDFGSAAFGGDGRWLGIRLKCSGDSVYTDLGRHELTAAPYALHALSVAWSGVIDVPADLADGDDDTLGGLSCANGQIAEWNGSVWACGDDDLGSGDIDAVYTGEGLSGGGQSGAVTITLDLPVPTATLALNANQVPWPGLTGMPAGFADGVDDVVAVVSGTNIFAGDGLTQISGTNSVTMAVYFAGSGGDYGTAISVARSDHAHDSRYYTEGELNTSGGGGQVHWNNLTNVPSGFADGTDDVGLAAEADPIFSASAANGISSGDVTNWNTAYGWGDHSTQGYLTSYTETDPVWIAASVNYYTQGNMQTSGQSQLHWNNLTNVPTGLADGDDDTTYTAGDGLALNGAEFSAAGSAYDNVVIVARSGGDYTSVQAAINSISDAAADNAYLVWVAPGVYTEIVTMKPYVHLQGAGQEATIITSAVSNSSEPCTQATLVLTRYVTLRDLTVHNNGTGVHNIALLAMGGTTQTLVADVTARAQGSGTANYGILLHGSGTEVKLQDVTALGEDGSVVNYGLFNQYGAKATLRGGFFTARGGGQAYALVNHPISTTLDAENVTVLAEGASWLNIGAHNDEGGIMTLRGGSFIARGGTDARGINNTKSTLEAQSVTALGENSNIDNYGLYSGVSAVATLKGGSFIGRGGSTAYGIRNDSLHYVGTVVLDAEHVTVLGENSSGSNYGLYNGNSANAWVTQSVLEGATYSVIRSSGAITVSNSRLVGGGVSGSVTCVLVTRGTGVSTDGSTCP